MQIHPAAYSLHQAHPLAGSPLFSMVAFGFRPFRAATATTTMATSTMPGTTATGGVLRRVAAMLGTGT